MTDSSGPFFPGSPWSEAEWYAYAPLWAGSGVIGTPAPSATSGELAFASSGLGVSAGTGKAWVRGAGFKRTGTPPVHAASPNGHASFARRDRLVLRRDLANHVVTTAIVQGTPQATPTAPDLTQVEGGVWEMSLFSFLVPPNSGTVLSGITDERLWLDPNGEQRFVHEGYVLAPAYAQPLPAASNIQMKASNYSADTDGDGVLAVPFATPFPIGVINVTPTGITTAVGVPLNGRDAVSRTGFSIVCLDLNGALLRNTSVDITYFAIGF